MNIPQNGGQVLIIVLLVIPGFVFTTVRTRRRGPSPDDRSMGVRILRSIGVSAALAALYLVIFGSWGVEQLLAAGDGDGFALEYPRLSALLGLVLVGVVPAALGVLDDLRQEGKFDRGRFRLRYEGRYNPIPSSWDFAGPGLGNTFVRVRLQDGNWVGGWFGTDSFLSGYPEPRDIFIQSQWRLTKDGEFLDKVADTRGVYVSCGNADVVEWLNPPSSAPSSPVEEAGCTWRDRLRVLLRLWGATT
jgi:hypothetical protein